MPVYSYRCECGKEFEELFDTISKAAPFIDAHKCKCGKTAKRTLTGAPKFFFNFADAPMYSSNFDRDKD